MAASRRSISLKNFILLVLLASLLLVGSLFAALYFSGLRWLSYNTDEHGTVRFVGRVDRNGDPVSGKVYYPDGSSAKLSYEGETLTYSDGSSIKGRIVKLDYGSGKVYRGEITAMLRDGNGALSLEGGDLYEGSFAYDEFSGKGIYYYENGDVYAGEFKNGVKWGSGTYKWATDDDKCDVYVGSFKNNLRDGNGKYTYADGTVYEGEYKNDAKNGKGRMTFASGAVYEGEFKNDLRSGKGKYLFANGDVYEGDFYMNTITGYGSYHWADGERADYTGYFENGKIVTVEEPDKSGSGSN